MRQKTRIYTPEEEERKKIEYERTKKRRELKNKGTLKREDFIHPGCKKKFKYGDCVGVEIGTMNRVTIDTAYIEMVINIAYTTDDNSIYQFKHNCSRAVDDWLRSQDMWDKRNRIGILEWHGTNRQYAGTAKSFTLQYHFRRDQTTTFKDTFDNLKGLTDILFDTIKKTCVETGLELTKWKTSNPKGKNQWSSNEVS